MGIQIYPEVEAAGGGYNFELIGTINLATGTPASVSFTAIDPKYRALKLIITGAPANAGGTYFSGAARMLIRFNGDTAANYTSFFRQLSTATWAASSGRAGGINDAIVNGTTGNAEQSAVYYIYETNGNTAKTISGFGHFGSTTVSALELGIWRDTAAIDEIDLIATGGNTFTEGRAILLGSE
jgi:hypothetical protein